MYVCINTYRLLSIFSNIIIYTVGTISIQYIFVKEFIIKPDRSASSADWNRYKFSILDTNSLCSKDQERFQKISLFLFSTNF